VRVLGEVLLAAVVGCLEESATVGKTFELFSGDDEIPAVLAAP
jgi:hypothetical protein